MENNYSRYCYVILLFYVVLKWMEPARSQILPSSEEIISKSICIAAFTRVLPETVKIFSLTRTETRNPITDTGAHTCHFLTWPESSSTVLTAHLPSPT